MRMVQAVVVVYAEASREESEVICCVVRCDLVDDQRISRGKLFAETRLCRAAMTTKRSFSVAPCAERRTFSSSHCAATRRWNSMKRQPLRGQARAQPTCKSLSCASAAYLTAADDLHAQTIVHAAAAPDMYGGAHSGRVDDDSRQRPIR